MTNQTEFLTIAGSKIIDFQNSLIEYHSLHGRNYLPWRSTNDPWKILLSEMLLRKTTAVQVKMIYPLIENLKPEDIIAYENEALEKILSKLGLQNERARLLKIVSKKVSEAGIDKLSDSEFLLSLPGIGYYARNAVLCFSFGEPWPALDRNMIRVLDRVFTIRSNNKRPHTDKMLWKIAKLLVPINQPREYNWGVLDLSAEICRPNKPRCCECPINSICDYVIQEKGKNEI